MGRTIALITILSAAAAVPAVRAQARSGRGEAPIAGTWQLAKGKVKAEGPKLVVIRPDSSASWGKETVRWRLVDDRIMIALGGEWEIYKLKLRPDRMTLSGGDLTEEITLRRIGPHTPRPDSIPIPPDPDRVP
jgi:hypothetical protein